MSIKNVSFVCYPESCDLEKVISRRLNSICQYAYILHDKDLNDDGSLKKAHYHVVIRFIKGVNKTSVANDFGISPSLVQPLGNLVGNIAYMLHKNLPDKFQYEVSDIVSYRLDIDDILKDYSNLGVSDSQIIHLIIEKFYSGCNLYEVLNFVLEHGYIDIYKKYYSILRDLYFNIK